MMERYFYLPGHMMNNTDYDTHNNVILSGPCYRSSNVLSSTPDSRTPIIFVLTGWETKFHTHS